MNFIGILYLAIFATVFKQVLTSESSSTSQTQQRIFDFSTIRSQHNLNKFINQFNGFFTGQVPVYYDIIQDINNKLSEFGNLNGIQPFLSFGSLYSQYLQLYSIWRQQHTQLLNSIKDQSRQAAGSVGPYLYFYPQNFHRLVKSFEEFIAAEEHSIKSVLQIINAFFAAVSNPQFSYTETSFWMPYTNALGISSAINQLSDADAKLKNSCQSFIFAFNGTLIYQNSGNTLKYIQALIDLNEETGDCLMRISRIEHRTSKKFIEYNTLSKSTGIFNASIQQVNSIFFYDQKKISEYFIKIVDAGNRFQSDVLNLGN